MMNGLCRENFGRRELIVELAKQKILSSAEELSSKQKEKIKNEVDCLKETSSLIFYSERMAEAIARKLLLPERATRRHLKELLTGSKDDGMDVIDLLKPESEEIAMLKRLGWSDKDKSHIRMCLSVEQIPEELILIFSELLKLMAEDKQTKITSIQARTICKKLNISIDVFLEYASEIFMEDIAKVLRLER